MRMSDNKPSPLFLAAASYLATAPSQVSTTTKLELYGLFKYVTTSPLPSTPRPSIFDMTGRAKWDAWSSTGKTFTLIDDAEKRYLEIARSIGWNEGSTVVTTDTKNTDLEHNIWDDESPPKRRGDTSAGGGMGAAVSTMMISDAEADGSIHGLAVSNDVSGLFELLQQQPETDINQRDEFGYTPLHLACDRGNLSAAEFLLGKGADPTMKDFDGLSAIQLAVIAGHDAIEEQLKSHLAV